MASRSSLRGRVGRATLKGAGALHRTLYRASGGRVGGSVKGVPVLLLTTTGRRSGKSRTTPLLYLRDGDALAVVASNGGRDWPPAWWLNLQREPRAAVELGRERRAVTARKAAPEEHARLWAEFTRRYGGYETYAQRTTREIPVVVLEEAAAAGS